MKPYQIMLKSTLKLLMEEAIQAIVAILTYRFLMEIPKNNLSVAEFWIYYLNLYQA